MKKRFFDPEIDSGDSEEMLCRALLSLKTVEEMQAFLRDLCTPAELEAMRDRWCVVPHLLAGQPYREIYEHTAVSITTIGRVARTLGNGSEGGYQIAARRLRARGKLTPVQAS